MNDFQIKVQKTVNTLYFRNKELIENLHALYRQAKTEPERAYICVMLALRTCNTDMNVARAWITKARQHAIDDFETLCYIGLAETIILAQNQAG